MNSITELLNFEDENLIVSKISIEGTSKTITLETLPVIVLLANSAYISKVSNM